jgi:hypothetical protein
MKNNEWCRNRARELYHDEGEIEVDADARVSRGNDDGAYVEAWVWVPFPKERPNSHSRGSASRFVLESREMMPRPKAKKQL